MTAAQGTTWSFATEGLKEIEIALKSADLRIHRAQGTELTVRIDEGEEIGDWLQVEHSEGVLLITQRGSGSYAREFHFGPVEGEIQASIDGAMEAVDEAMGAFGELMEGFGEGFFSGKRRRPDRPRVRVRMEPARGHRHLHVTLGIPAAMEMPGVAGRLGRGDLAVEDFWGRMALRTGMGEVTLARCGNEVAVKTGRGNLTARECRGALDLHSGLGDARLTACEGTASVQTGKGTVLLERCRLQGSCHTGHGDLWLETITGSGTFHTGAGTITVIRPEATSLELHTGMGDVVVQDGAAESLRAHSGAGSLRVTGLRRADRLELHTGMGNAVAQGEAVGQLYMRAGAGNLESSVALGPGDHDLETGAGNIEVRLPDDARVRVDAVTRMGSVHSDFGLVKVGRPGPATLGGGRFVGSIGDGEATAVLHLKTGTGNIALRRLVRPAPAASPAPPPPPAPEGGRGSGEQTRLAVLQSLQRGEISVEDALALLEHLPA